MRFDKFRDLGLIAQAFYLKIPQTAKFNWGGEGDCRRKAKLTFAHIVFVPNNELISMEIAIRQKKTEET